MQKHQVDYEVVVDYFDTAVESEDENREVTEEDKREHQMIQEIYQLPVRETTLFSFDMGEEKWTLWILDDFSGKEKVELQVKMGKINRNVRISGKLLFIILIKKNSKKKEDGRSLSLILQKHFSLRKAINFAI